MIGKWESKVNIITVTYQKKGKWEKQTKISPKMGVKWEQHF